MGGTSSGWLRCFVLSIPPTPGGWEGESELERERKFAWVRVG